MAIVTKYLDTPIVLTKEELQPRACEPLAISDLDAPNAVNRCRDAVTGATTLEQLALMCEQFGLSLHVMRVSAGHWTASVNSAELMETSRGMSALDAIAGAFRAWIVAQGDALARAQGAP